MVNLQAGGQTLALLPQKAAYLPEQQTLLVADAHIGKAVSFRRWGVPVPSGTTSETLTRLSDLIDATQARRIVFLGDLLHSERSLAPATMEALHRWRERHAALELRLVRGNHDERAGDPPAEFGIESVDEPWVCGRLALCHHPQTLHGFYTLAGHVHPCVSVGGRSFDRLRLPCFHFSAHGGVLPAFGAFTGMHAIQPAPGDRVFAVTDEHVVEIS